MPAVGCALLGDLCAIGADQVVVIGLSAASVGRRRLQVDSPMAMGESVIPSLYFVRRITSEI